MSEETSLEFAYRMGYEDALVCNLPEPSKAHVLIRPKAHRIRALADERGTVGRCMCSECGGKVDQDDAFCRHCGKELT